MSHSVLWQIETAEKVIASQWTQGWEGKTPALGVALGEVPWLCKDTGEKTWDLSLRINSGTSVSWLPNDKLGGSGSEKVCVDIHSASSMYLQ